MVRWVNAQNFGSPISDAISQAGATLFGDTLTPALKKEQLSKARRENQGAEDLTTAIRDMGMNAPMPTGAPVAGDGDFLARMAPLAAQAVQGTNLDPRLVVAQAALETGWGKSAPGNNYFGIKGHGAPNAQPLPTTEVVNGQPVQVTDTFRTYASPEESVADYVRFLQTNPRYAELLSSQGLDAQVAALGQSGYATDPNYGSKVAQIASGIDMSAFTGTLPPAQPSPLTGQPSAVPGEYNPNSPQMIAELVARAVSSGAQPEEAAELVRALTANFYGAENQATVNASVGAGGNYAGTYSGFAADQNRQWNETVYEDQNEIVEVVRNGIPVMVRKGDMLPGDEAILSNTENQALTARGMEMTPEQELAYVGAEPKNVQQADTYIDANGNAYRSIDGLTDATTGKPLPPSAMKTSVISPDRQSAGLDKVNARNIEAQIYSLRSFQDDLAAATQIAQDPTLFGLVGRARAAGQNVSEQLAQFGAIAPEANRQLQSQNAETIAMLQDIDDPDGVMDLFFTGYDPGIPALALYAQLLPYAAAAAIANQTGRGLSDQDVRRFQAIVGDPTALFSTQQGFLTNMERLGQITEARIRRATGALESGVEGSGGPPTDTAPDTAEPTLPTAPTLPTIEQVPSLTLEQIEALSDVPAGQIPQDIIDALTDRYLQLQGAR